MEQVTKSKIIIALQEKSIKYICMTLQAGVAWWVLLAAASLLLR